MAFNSIQYLLFLPAIFILYYLLPSKYRWKLLLAASVCFYLLLSIKFIILLAIAITVNFFCAIKSENTTDSSKKSMYLHIAIWSSALILCIFKYYNFFVDSAAQLANSMGAHFSPILLNVAIPIGISFYTFQIIGYSLDVYYGVSKAEKNIGIFSLYIVFFPKLLAGPIEQSQNLLPQLHKKQEFNYDRITSGIKLIAWGLFKKVCIADRLTFFVDMTFDSSIEHTGFQSIIGCYFLVFMIYADFSGYSDIAVGSARLFGFELIKNFNRPFTSQNLTAFWKRWHISLYAWFNEYVYNPLAFNFRNWKLWGIVSAILITLTLSGLWHGAAWTFILYGILHGFGLTTEYLLTPFRTKLKQKLPAIFYKYLSILITFHFFYFTVIVFHANTVHDAFTIIKSFLQVSPTQIGWYLFGDNKIEFILAISFILILFTMEFWQSKTDTYLSFHLKLPIAVRWSAYALFVLTVVYFGYFKTNEFVYAQF